jgi:flagellar protein FlgJ
MIARTLSTGLAAAVAATGLVASAATPTAEAAGAGPPTGGTATAGVAAAVTARVSTGLGPLNVRNNASIWNDPVGRLSDGTRLTARCQLAGEEISGTARTSSLWLRIGRHRYVSDAYVAWRPRRPTLSWCDQPSDPAPGAHGKFISWAAKRARASRSRYKVPVSVSIAQAINESGWGRSSLTTQGNAYFGIKCFGTPGPVATGCRPYSTRECDNDDCFDTTATFRVYRTGGRSFMDHGRFLKVNPRYRKAFDYIDRPNRFAREIHRAGYATDPDYSDKLIRLMREHNLYRFD